MSEGGLQNTNSIQGCGQSRGAVNLHHLQHLTWLAWLRGQKNEQQKNDPNPKKQCSCRLSGSSENRAFEMCRFTESHTLRLLG